VFKAVSLFRLGKAGWQDIFFKLFTEAKSSALHTRAYQFLEIQNALDKFSEMQKNLFQAKYFISLGKIEDALPFFKTAVSNMDVKLLESTTLMANWPGFP